MARKKYKKHLLNMGTSIFFLSFIICFVIIIYVSMLSYTLSCNKLTDSCVFEVEMNSKIIRNEYFKLSEIKGYGCESYKERRTSSSHSSYRISSDRYVTRYRLNLLLYAKKAIELRNYSTYRECKNVGTRLIDNIYNLPEKEDTVVWTTKRQNKTKKHN